jgi:hypothetical protein
LCREFIADTFPYRLKKKRQTVYYIASVLAVPEVYEEEHRNENIYCFGAGTGCFFSVSGKKKH